MENEIKLDTNKYYDNNLDKMEISDDQVYNDFNNPKKVTNYQAKYFNKIRTSMPTQEENFLEIPKEYEIDNPFLPAYLVGLLDDKKPEEGKSKKVSSMVTIFSVWCCMIGSGILSIPWAFKQAGIIPAFFITIIYAVISFYTCYIYLKTGLDENDFSDTVARFLGRKYGFLGRIVQIIGSISINLGAVYIYFIIICQTLYPLLAYICNLFGANLNYKEGEIPNWSTFSIIYVGLILCVILFPFYLKKEVDFLIKLNSFGVYFVITLILFVVGVFIYSLTNTNYDFQYIKNEVSNDKKIRHLLLFGENPLKLCGSLTLSYISHTFVLPIMKNNRVKENNTRDLAIGYMLVCITLLMVGYFGYIGFTGSSFDPEFKEVIVFI